MWCIPVIAALERLWQEDLEFKASLYNWTLLCKANKQTNHTQKKPLIRISSSSRAPAYKCEALSSNPSTAKQQQQKTPYSLLKIHAFYCVQITMKKICRPYGHLRITDFLSF
jgi:hypothetical protein